jgi:CubicO group peptidase (beta-lactamase class C family)
MKIGPFAAAGWLLLSAESLQGQYAATPEPFPPATPEEVGVDPAMLRALSSRAHEWVDQEDAVGAALLVIKKRRTVLHEVYGLADLDDRTPLRLGTVACIRSMSKPIVGTAVQILVDEGRLSLDDAVARYVPSFANDKASRVTVRQLLTHTAGFPLTVMNRPLSTYHAQTEVTDQAGASGPTLPPGAFNYSDTDTEILATIVGRIAGEAPERFIQKRILDPLGMKDTFAVLGPGAPDRSRVSSNHAGGPAAWHKYWDNDDPPFFPFFLGAASMYSTVTDYARFVAMWLDRGAVGSSRTLSDAAVRRALEPAVAMTMGGAPYPTRFPQTQVYYGQHWIVFKGPPVSEGSLPPFGHTGSDGTGAWAFPEQDLMVLFFTQSRGGLAAIRIERFIAPLAGMSAPPAPVLSPLPADQIALLLGNYRGPSGRTAYVVRQRSRVAVQFPEGEVVLRWPNPQGQWPFDSLDGSTVSFSRDAGGRATGFNLLTGNAALRFTREDPAADLPDADTFARMRREKQGGDALDRLTSLDLTGTLTIGGASGTITMASSRDGGIKALVQVGTTEEETDIDGTHARRRNSVTGELDLRGIFLEQVKVGGPVARLLDWRRSFARVEVVRRDKIDGADVWIVRLTGTDLPPLTRFVSVESGLVVREESWVTSKGVGTFPMTLKYSDYRSVAGVMLPFHVESTSAITSTQVVQYTDIKTR